MTDTLERIARELRDGTREVLRAYVNEFADKISCEMTDYIYELAKVVINRAELANRGAGRDVRSEARAFLDAVKACIPHINSDRSFAAAHGIKWTGPSWQAELSALTDALADQPSDELKPEATETCHVVMGFDVYNGTNLLCGHTMPCPRHPLNQYGMPTSAEATEKAETARERAHRILDAVIDVPEHFGPSLVQAIAAAKVEKGE